ncbi:hypothetical protein B0J13DRAFT_105255 [Dactylonectria estremocensis]|uniref:ABM domain-containing protein n=1 Tax=Dactylonectria estremocensis TaxID=1079267 RepID=A0A9P9E6B5_9HYPO|nr:hypothetical protein B0J13DRAFT_105255 [Dactylonectria estremocensis]
MRTKWMVSTWTRFQVPDELPIDGSIFAPLASGDTTYHRALYGRLHESPGECLLFVAWESLQDYEAFKKTDEHQQLMTNLKSATSDATAEPKTQMIDFGQVAFWERFGRDVEILTVYFPSSISPQDQEAVKKIRPLVDTLAPLEPAGVWAQTYKRRPVCGWAKDSEILNGQSVLASVWCHYWKDKANENKFKTMERRGVWTMQGPQGPLALEAFEHDLKEMGAIEWVGYHIDFQNVPGSLKKMTEYIPDFI